MEGESWRKIKDKLLSKMNGVCGAVFEGKMYVWGGQSCEEEEDEDYDEVVRTPIDLPRDDDEDKVIDVYDVENRVWW